MPEIRSFRNYSIIKNEELRSELNNINWYYSFDCPEIDEKTQRFNTILHYLHDKFAPVKSVIVRDPNTPWLISQIRNLQKDREIAYSLWRNRRVRRKGDAL